MDLCWMIPVLDEFFFTESTLVLTYCLEEVDFIKLLREQHFRQEVDHNMWIDYYHEMEFFRLFRMKKQLFFKLIDVILENDTQSVIKKKYRGGLYPVHPERGLLVFLWFMSKQDTLHAIGDRFNMVPSTVMNLVNGFLYIVVGLKKKYLYWPQSEREYEYVKNGFKNYPGTIGAVDGCHIPLKVPLNQHTSYIDRHQNHSIKLMAVCTASKLFTYVFIGYPGSAHDSRVFSNSSLVRNLERFGTNMYFAGDVHLIGDSAFPLRTWLMKPYPKQNLTVMQKLHNYKLSADRVCIENTFGILKSRWARLKYINTYCVSKAIEITTAACVLHNFCYIDEDEWEEVAAAEVPQNENMPDNDREAYRLGQEKRDALADQIFMNQIEPQILL